MNPGSVLNVFFSPVGTIKSNEDGALGLLREDAGDATLLRTQYLADQSGFLDNYITELGDEAVGIALKNVPGLTAAKLLKTVTGDLPEPTLAGYYEEYLLGESFHLAEHHFYGNKRLGIKYYWPATGWGWDATTGYIPYLNTWITSRVPWYSRAMNEFIQPDITEPRYNKLDYSSWFSSRLLGTKRFELTDHLGNVSSVILDRKTPVNTGSVLHKYDPDVQLVLDYYPYGMVMKEGYCDTCDPNAVTQTTGPALKMVNTDYTLLPQNYPPLTGSTVANWSVVTGGEAEPQEEGQLSWEGTGGGMLFTCLNEVNPGNHELGLTALMEVTAEEAHEIEIVVDIDDAGELEAKIISYTDPEHTEYDVLTSTEIPTSTGYLLQFTPTTDTVWLWIGRKAEHGFASGTKFKITGTTTAKTTWTVYQMNIQGLLHSWRSPYRFAYNGQERVDDIKGKTNHNTALYGEYDTRRAWRWNLDPKPNPSMSPYLMYGGNPIWHSDLLLDTPSVKQAALIANHVYGGKDAENTNIGDWRQIDAPIPGVTYHDKESGYDAGLYARTKEGKTDYVFATRGTEGNWNDIVNDVAQPLGLSKQYTINASNAKALQQYFGEKTDLTFVGHSLGGGLAAANSMVTNFPAITFNAAGVSMITKAKISSSFATFARTLYKPLITRIDAYIVRGEALNMVQTSLGIGIRADGKIHKIDPSIFSIYRYDPTGISGHTMGAVKNALDNEGIK